MVSGLGTKEEKRNTALSAVKKSLRKPSIVVIVVKVGTKLTTGGEGLLP